MERRKDLDFLIPTRTDDIDSKPETKVFTDNRVVVREPTTQLIQLLPLTSGKRLGLRPPHRIEQKAPGTSN